MYETMGDWVWILYRRVQENGLPRPPGRMPVRVFWFRGQMFMHEIFTLWRPLILDKLFIIHSIDHVETEVQINVRYSIHMFSFWTYCLISYKFIFDNSLCMIREISFIWWECILLVIHQNRSTLKASNEQKNIFLLELHRALNPPQESSPEPHN